MECGCEVQGYQDERCSERGMCGRERASTPHIDIVFDGPPSHESGRFVEVENAMGRSVGFGTWVEREDGFWALRITKNDCSFFDAAAICDRCDGSGWLEPIGPKPDGSYITSRPCPRCDATGRL